MTAFTGDLVKIVEHIHGAVVDPDGNFSTVEHLLSDDVVWTTAGVAGTVPFAGTFNGKREVATFFTRHDSAVKNLKLTTRYHTASGSSVNVHLIEEGTVRATNKSYRMETMSAWRFDANGKIVAYRNYNDTYAMFHAFDPVSDPSLSISIHDADYRARPAGAPTIDVAGVVDRWYKIFKGEGSILDFVDDDIVFILPGAKGVTPFAGQYVGLDQLLGFLTALGGAERIEEVVVNPEDGAYVVDGFVVDDEMLERTLVFSTGKEFNIKGAHSMTISNEGKIKSWRSYNDTYEIARAFAS